VLRRTITALRALPVRAIVSLDEVISPEEVPSADNVVTVISAPHGAVEASALHDRAHDGLPRYSVTSTHSLSGTMSRAALRTIGCPR
jgi:hypothetical protein